MLLLISDANILIDMEAGEILGLLFQLPMRFAIPDILYWEEIEPGTANSRARTTISPSRLQSRSNARC